MSDVSVVSWLVVVATMAHLATKYQALYATTLDLVRHPDNRVTIER